GSNTLGKEQRLTLAIDTNDGTDINAHSIPIYFLTSRGRIRIRPSTGPGQAISQIRPRLN
ncbi:hypothetical protein, partial [Vibrio sp. HB161653]|uniref:hypothetical protein n=1 Tax=Vibrio sp. HB161653 TaxID=3068274 RepID=UPI00273DFBEC